MTIQNVQQLDLFKKSLAQCKRALLVETCDGEQFDMRTPRGFIHGLAALMKRYEIGMEPEIFTNCAEDQCVMAACLRNWAALA